jgi:rubredoxin
MRSRLFLGRDMRGEVVVKRYMCLVCGLVYDEEQGWPDDGIAPGTKWEDVPANWLCPECGAGKEDFEMVEL